jgi:2-C-methyl-D-erythritol 4-phosphate cytidylyltransferase
MKKSNNINNFKASAIIVAAGRGSRMNMDINKQYIEVAGKPVLARTLEAFNDCSFIDEIIVVVNEKDIIFCKQHIIDFYEFNKVKTIVAGGDERQKSVYNGLKEVNIETDVVLIHDGARPFINEESIKESISAAMEFGGSVVAVPVKDTIKTADSHGIISQTIDRSTLWSIQTPQTFKYDLIMYAHKSAIEDGFIGTDDSVLLERLGYKLKLVMGGYNNIKITTKEDLIVAEAIVGQGDIEPK